MSAKCVICHTEESRGTSTRFPLPEVLFTSDRHVWHELPLLGIRAPARPVLVASDVIKPRTFQGGQPLSSHPALARFPELQACACREVQPPRNFPGHCGVALGCSISWPDVVTWPERFLLNGQCAIVDRFSLRISGSPSIKLRQIVQACHQWGLSCPGMFSAIAIARL